VKKANNSVPTSWQIDMILLIEKKERNSVICPPLSSSCGVLIPKFSSESTFKIHLFLIL
jgi:hypothetical protein